MASKKFRRSTTGLTVNRLADETGIDRRIVRKRCVDAGVYPPEQYDRDKVLAAVKPPEKKETVSTVGGTKEDEQYEKWRKLRIKNDKDEGKLVPMEFIEQGDSSILARVDQILEQKLCNEYPSAVAGLDVPQARVYGKRLGDQIREEFNKLKEHRKR